MTADDLPAPTTLSEPSASDRAAPSIAAVEPSSRHGVDRILVPFVALVVIGAIYGETAVDLVRVWSIDPNYSHGFVVPVLSLLFAWAAGSRSRLASPSGPTPALPDAGIERGEVVQGLCLVVVGLLLHFAAWFAQHLLLDAISLVCVVRGALRAGGGRPALQTFGFAASFLVFMAPLPMAWYQPLARWLQQIASASSAELLGLCGVAVHRTGYVLHLQNCTLEVGEACSGVRQLTAILALAVAIGHFAGTRAWFRWTLACAALPVAVAANCLRVVLTAAIALWFGPSWVEGTYHTLEGMGTIALAAALLVALAAALSRLDRATKASAPTGTRRTTAVRPLGFRTRATWLLALLCGGLVLQGGLQRHLSAAAALPAESLAKPLAGFPVELGEWRGRDATIDDPRLLYADEHLCRTYRRGDGDAAVEVWMAFSQSGADRFHHPEVCMAVAGRPEDPAGRRTLALPGHDAEVQQFRFGARGDYQRVFYWHYTLPLPPCEGLDALQGLFRQMRCRPASLTIEVFVPERGDTEAEDARRFVALLDTALQPYLPPGAIRGSQRKPVTVINER